MNAELRYSQNFLHSLSTVRKILALGNIRKGDTVYEIGAGRGIITGELSRLCRELYAIEKDEKLFSRLMNSIGHRNIKLIHADVLDYPFPRMGSYKVFSNIPFSISSEILDKLLFSSNPPVDSYLIVQRESAERYAGQPYSRNSLKSLLLKPFFFFEILHELKPKDFRPAPRVSSVLLRIKKHDTFFPGIHAREMYYDFISYAFQQRSGTIFTRLSRLFTKKQLRILAQDSNIDLDAGIRSLDYQQIISLFSYYLYNISEEKKRLCRNSYPLLKKHHSGLRKIHRSRQ